MKFHVISRSMIRRWLYSQYCLFKHDWILHWNVWRLLKNNNTLIFDYISSMCGIFDIPIFLYLKHITPCSFLTLLFGFLHFTDRRITWQLQPFSFRKQMAEISQNLKDLTLFFIITEHAYKKGYNLHLNKKVDIY